MLLYSNKIIGFDGFNKTQYIENLPTFQIKIYEKVIFM
jgi:hypothetical protein